MLTVEVVVSKELDKTITRLEDYDRVADKRLRTAMKKSVVSVEAGAKRRAPVGVSGRLRNTMASTVTKRANEILGKVGSTMKSEVYPLVMEEGRRAGSKAPPPGALDRWVRLVLKVPSKRVKSAAYLVGRKIAKHGIKGKFFLHKSFIASKAKINAWFKRALVGIVKDLAGKK